MLLLELDDNLKKRFEEAANALKIRLGQKANRDFLKRIMTEKKTGRFYKCKKMDADALVKIVENGGVAGVDGSTNSGGGIFPYVVTLQQALAKHCHREMRDILLSDAFSPLLMEEALSEDEYREYIKEKLATLEVNAALLALEEFKPAVLLMDGSLVRFKIEASHLWEKLKNKAVEHGTLLVGVVEGIATSIIRSALKDVPEIPPQAMDWEILFGLLEVGEVLEMAPGLFKEGFRTCFARFSTDPKPIGLDMPEEQYDFLGQVEDLIFTLTPDSGRGIPLWLDIIDKKVRITNMMMEALMNTYLGEDYAELICPKRSKR
jgi:hypothetical protein